MPCLFSGVKQTSRIGCQMSANDPKRTSAGNQRCGLGVGINDIPTSIHEIVELLLERRDLDLCVFEIVLKPL